MQRQVLILITLIAFLTFGFCKTISQNTTESKIIQVDIENCKVSIDLKLSDLIDSCWLVPLETTKDCTLGNYFNYVFISDDFILIDDRNGIYKFSADGKFIRKIISVGRGPQELSVSPMYYYYEKKNILFISDYLGEKDYILCYDVESESFLPSIKKCFNGRWANFIIYDDSLIMASLSILDPDSNPYAIFFQNFKGDFVSGIKSTRKFVHFKDQKEALQRMFIYTGNQLVHVKYCLDDTLFALKGSQLSPYLMSSYNSPRINPPHFLLKPDIGDKQTYFERFENSGFMIFRNTTFEGEIQFSYGAKADYKTVYYFLNKSNGKYGIIRSYIDDFTGKTQSSENETMVFPSSLPNDKLYVIYYPHELLQKTPSDLVNKRYSDIVYSQLSEIRNNISETDNPILLIGKPKKRLLIPK